MSVNAILSLTAIADSMTSKVDAVTFEAATRAERIDQIVDALRKDIESIGGSLEFKQRHRVARKSAEPIDVSALFDEYPNLRYVNLDMLRAAADQLGVDITPYGSKRKDIYNALCEARRELNLPAPVAPVTKNSQIAPGIDIRTIPTHIFRTLLQRAGIDPTPYRSKKNDMIVALAAKFNKAPEDIVKAAKVVADRNKANPAETKVAASKTASVSEAPVEVTEAVEMTEATEAATEVATEATEATEAADIHISVNVPTDNPFLQGRPAQVESAPVEQQFSDASMDLENLLS